MFSGTPFHVPSGHKDWVSDGTMKETRRKRTGWACESNITPDYFHLAILPKYSTATTSHAYSTLSVILPITSLSRLSSFLGGVGESRVPRWTAPLANLRRDSKWITPWHGNSPRASTFDPSSLHVFHHLVSVVPSCLYFPELQPRRALSSIL